MDTKILLVDDEPRILRTFARSLRLAGYTVVTAKSGKEGLALYFEERPDITLLDLRMPDVDGLTVLQSIRDHDPEANVILCTGHGDQEAVITALRAGASDFLPKPIDPVTLESALRRAEERIHLKRELRASQEALRQHNVRLEEEVRARTAELEREIEEHKRTGAALRKSEARERARAADLKAIMDAVPAVIWIARDPQGHYIVGNPAANRLLRMEEEENTSLTPGQGLPPTHFKLCHQGGEVPVEELPMQMACKYGVETRNYEGEVVFEDGTQHIIFGNTVPLRDEEGQVRGAIAAYVDITERKEAEVALRESEKRFRMVFNNVRDGVFVHPILPDNQPGPFLQVNDAACAMLGYSREEFRHMTPWELDDPSTTSDYIPQAMKELQEKGRTVFEAVQMAKGGRKVLVEVNASACELQGRPYIISVVRDITERKRAEEQLRQYTHRLEQMVNNADQVSPMDGREAAD
jgi:PAS domain S-box-containing protein